MRLGYPGVVCAGCGTSLTWAPGAPEPFRCPNARPGDDVDHVLQPTSDPEAWQRLDATSLQPFMRYRHRLYSYRLARTGGMTDPEFCALVDELDRAVEAVDGRGFRVTPTERAPELARELGLGAGGFWVKDETRNVSGSHKGRHLFGVMLYLLVSERLRGGASDALPAPLAIASCGNAALAAAVVARAAERELRVFIPPSADPVVVARLEALGAHLTICERRAEETGDPCYLRFREAVDAGAVPFCCQGPDNGLTIEGGKTLAYEAIEALETASTGRFDRVFLQVGGGAFASAFIQAYVEAERARAVPSLPAFHAVQTHGAYPLARAFESVREGARSVEEDRHRIPGAAVPASEPAGPAWAAALGHAVRHRHEAMRPWESEPHSIAHGILDDETYDWCEIVRGMLGSGGGPIVVSEDELRQANALAREATGVDVDHTGSAGLAGLLQLVHADDADARLALQREQVMVVFTGQRRSA